MIRYEQRKHLVGGPQNLLSEAHIIFHNAMFHYDPSNIVISQDAMVR